MPTQGIQQVNRPHNVRAEGQDRVGIGQPYQRLRSQVKHNFRLCGLDQIGGYGRVAQVGHVAGRKVARAQKVEKRRPLLRRKSNSGHSRPKTGQLAPGPGTLEAGMPGQKNAFAAPEAHAQTFHGARPSAQSFSR